MASRQRRRRSERRREHAKAQRGRRRAIAGAGLGAGALIGLAPAAGAAEFEVTNLDDGAGPPAGSLRDAVADANANGGPDTIVFDSALSGSLFLTNGQLLVTDEVEIQGPGPDVLTIDAYYSNSRIFRLDMVTPEEAVAISGLGLTYGSSPYLGGAIRNDDAELSISDSALMFNTSSATTNDPPPSVALGGGAIGDVAGAGAVSLIDSSTIALNSATGGAAGGIGSLGELGTILNSTIAGNYAEVQGGGLNATAATIQNSTIAGNYSYGVGGGIAAPGAGGPSVALENSIVADNGADGAGDDLIGSDPFTADFTLLENTTGATINTTVSGSNLIGQDPDLDYMLQYNGGPTPNLAPSYGSPVIDQGLTAGSASADQRGEPRPFDVTGIANSAAAGADGADMGAVELGDDETSPADLELGMSDAPDPVIVGNPITYTIEVINNGPEDATGVVITVALSEQLSYRPAGSSAGCASVGGDPFEEVECTVGSIVSGDTATRTIVANTLPGADAVPYVTGYAFVGGDQVDPYSYDNSGYADTVVDSAPVVNPPPPPQVRPAFNLKAALKKCKKIKPKRKRTKCIKKARKKAAASAIADPRVVVRHPFVLKQRPPALKELPKGRNGFGGPLP